jgi:PAS domain S-box-containing protein
MKSFGETSGKDRGIVIVLLDEDAVQRVLVEARGSLSDSESLVRTLLEVSPQAVMAVEPSGTIVWTNHETEKMFGYAAGDLVSQPMEILEADRGRHAAYRARFFAEAKSRPMGIRMSLQARRKDGTRFPIEICLSTAEQDGQRLAVAFVSDITEPERLHQRDRELAVLFDNSPDPLLRIDSNLYVTHANPANERAAVPLQEIIGRHIRDVPVPGETAETAEFLIREVFRTGRPSTTKFSQPTPEGVREFEVRYVPEVAADGSLSAVYSIARDITEQVVAQNMARERERELTSLFDNSPDVIVRMDRNLRASYRNLAWELVSGLSREQTSGKSGKEIGLPSDIVKFQTDAVRKVLKTKRPVTAELSHPSSRGTAVYEVRHIPEFAANGSVSSVLTIGRDITEEVRLRKLSEANARDIHGLTTRLIKAHEQERRRISREIHDSLCQELGVLASELRSLSPTFASSDPATDRLRAAQERALRIAEEARHLAFTLHPSVLEDLGLSKALQSLCEEFSEREGIEAGCRISSLPHAIPQEAASCIYRIAQETLSNISKHANATLVSVQLIGNRNRLRLSIGDNGVGFDRGAVRGAGGLGLVSMEERASIVGAKLNITGVPGRGTRVNLIVPIQGGKRETSAHSAGR